MKTAPVVVVLSLMLFAAICVIGVQLDRMRQVEEIRTAEDEARAEGYEAGKQDAEKDDDFACPCGFMIKLQNGKQFVSGVGGYYAFDEKTGNIGDDLVQLPWGSRIITLTTLRRWEVNQMVSFFRDPKHPVWVEVDFAGIETPESSAFIHDMEQKTLYRHPSDSYIYGGQADTFGSSGWKMKPATLLAVTTARG